jgi:hypothetical protein
VKNDAINIIVQVSLLYLDLPSFGYMEWDIFGVGSVYHMAIKFLVFRGISIPLSIMALIIYIPTNSG